MANLTYTGATSTSPLVVSSSGVSSPCEPREVTTIPGAMGMGGYDLMTYQRLASALYAHPPPPSSGPLDSPTAPPPITTTAMLPGGHDPLLHGGSLELKEGLGSLGGPGWPYPMYYPYDSLAAYPFTHGYGVAFDAARRKNATRETTATLKAWLNEHKKNPYPTKGEKIMLAIITKMTLTQVSTWFANARRRLKKENKMTWEPRTKTDDDDDEDDDKDDDNLDDRRKDVDVNDRDDCRDLDDGRDSPPRIVSPSSTTGTGLDLNHPGHGSQSPVKPRIWSLADMAASSSSPSSSAATAAAIGKMVHRPMHLDTSPYGRPPLHQGLPGHRIASPQEALLQVYAKSLGFAGHHPAFSPLGFNGLTSSLAPCHIGEPMPSSLGGGLPPTLQPVITRPVATRPLPPSSSPSLVSSLQHILPGGAKITPAPPPNHRPEG